jgi:hypothetical protein
MKRALALALYLPARWRERWLPDDWLQRLGDTLQRRQDVVRRLQWLFVGIYYVLLIVPAILPRQAAPGHLFASLAGIAEMIFWGIWWPAVILVTLLFGQFWCGVFCPDGALTEAISRHGRGGKIPAWVRWPGWPLLAFSVVLSYEHLVNAYGSPRAILVSVGGASLLAWICGYCFGRGKRVWCRYLCPASSIFSLLSRCAIFHFKVNREAWDAAPKPLPRAVDCPPLLDVRRLRSNEKCSMCGRCSGHRNAVQLSFRAPGSEILRMGEGEIRVFDAFAICTVLIGVCYGAIHGREGWVSGLLHQSGVTGNALATLSLSLTALGLASVVALALWAAGRGRRVVACHLAYSLIPLAGGGLFLGALEHSFRLLEEAGVAMEMLRRDVRLCVVVFAAIWAWRLGAQVLKQYRSDGFHAGELVHAGLIGGLALLYIFLP